MTRRQVVFLLIIIGAGALAFCFSWVKSSLFEEAVHLVDIKTATSIDADLAPVQPTDTFPAGTSKVFCWFKWQDSPVGTQITAKWEYLTERIHVLNYNFSIPRRNGAGGISLTMPEGKTLLPGTYQIILLQGKKNLRSVNFQVK